LESIELTTEKRTSKTSGGEREGLASQEIERPDRQSGEKGKAASATIVVVGVTTPKRRRKIGRKKQERRGKNHAAGN